jgi:hypothetical protein
MYLCVTIDGAQFDGPQEQGFEDVPEQQQFFDKGKWSLISGPNNSINTHIYFICMHVSRI